MTVTAGVSTIALAVDTRARNLAAADHVVHALDHVLAEVAPERAGYVASTHFVGAEDRHVAVAASWEGELDPELLSRALAKAFPDAAVLVAGAATGTNELADGVRTAVDEHRSRRAGRLARFPGQAEIERRLTVAEVLAVSCVDEVKGLAGVEVGPDSELDLTGFVRPQWQDGRCTVVVQPAIHGLVPFEVRDQIPCCSAH
jgi:hypothetical protein